MAELFDVSTDNVGLHLKNIVAEGELDEKSVTKESSVTAADGKNYRTKLYRLDAILAAGYRVRSPRGVQFRRWASTVLKEFLLKGFVMDDERMKNPDGRPDHFDEMLERIREIRASEKRFYQKVRDLLALSTDYDKTDKATQQFFAMVQNILRPVKYNKPARISSSIPPRSRDRMPAKRKAASPKDSSAQLGKGQGWRVFHLRLAS